MTIEGIKPYPKNPKEHPEKHLRQLRDIVAEVGWRQPVLVNQEGVIVAGHGRFATWQKYENLLKPIWVINDSGNTIHGEAETTPLTEDQEKAYRLADNKLNESPWKMELVIGELKDLDSLGVDINLTGFNKDLILTPEPKDDYVPNNVPARTQPGDLWSLGEHRVLCGDATKKEDVDKLLDGKKAHMTFTDPPYNVNYEGNTKDALTIKGDNESEGDFRDFLKSALENIIANTEGGVYVCMSSSQLGNLKAAFEEAGGHWQSFIIWVKSHFTLGRADYQHTYEPILYGWPKSKTDHYFVGERNIANVWEDLRDIKTTFDGTHTTIAFQGFKVRVLGKVEEGSVIRKKQHTDIWRYDKPTKSAEHPTMKPVALIMEAITNSSKEGQLVLDTFLGSGSTVIAAEKTGRKCYGLEIDPKYVDVAVKRWEEYTGKEAKKL